MMISLPRPIANYFSADKKQGDAVALCFTETGVVFDDNERHIGGEAISHWKENASTKFDYIAEPCHVSDENGQVVVIVNVSGDFPSSPIKLRYIFEIVEEKISKLEITL